MINFVNKIKNTILNWMQHVELEILVFIGIAYFCFLSYLFFITPPSSGLGFMLMFLYTSIIYLIAEFVLIAAYQINRKYFKKHLKINMPKWYKILWAICIMVVSFFNLYVLGIWCVLIAYMIF